MDCRGMDMVTAFMCVTVPCPEHLFSFTPRALVVVRGRVLYVYSRFCLRSLTSLRGTSVSDMARDEGTSTRHALSL